jgi:hypothetical protein
MRAHRIWYTWRILNPLERCHEGNDNCSRCCYITVYSFHLHYETMLAQNGGFQNKCVKKCLCSTTAPLEISSVADSGCLSRIPDPDFYPSRIPDLRSQVPDPKTATKERGEKKLDVKPFYVATKFNKIVNYFSFKVLKTKIWANFQRIIELFLPKKLSKSSSKYGLGIRDPIQWSKRHRIPDPQHWKSGLSRNDCVILYFQIKTNSLLFDMCHRTILG